MISLTTSFDIFKTASSKKEALIRAVWNCRDDYLREMIANKNDKILFSVPEVKQPSEQISTSSNKTLYRHRNPAGNA